MNPDYQKNLDKLLDTQKVYKYYLLQRDNEQEVVVESVQELDVQRDNVQDNIQDSVQRDNEQDNIV